MHHLKLLYAETPHFIYSTSVGVFLHLIHKLNEMASAESPLPPPTTILSTPLIVALAIISSVSVALITLHLLLTRLCITASRSAHGPNTAMGVDKAVLDSFSIIAYTKKGKDLGMDDDECSVCLGVFEEGESLRSLPACCHVFHVQCVDRWLAAHSNCPLCRVEVAAIVSEPVVLVVDAVEEEPVGEDGRQEASVSGELVRSGSLLWPCSACSRLLSLWEKLQLKRLLSFDRCNLSCHLRHDREPFPSESPSMRIDV